MAEKSKLFKLGLGLLIFLVVATIFERFNIFLPILGFSLKLSLLILPLAALLLLFSRKLLFNPTFLFPALFGLGLSQLLSVFFSFDRGQSLQVLAFTILMMALFYLLVWISIARAGAGKGGLAVLTPFIWAWGGGALLVSLLGIGQFWLHFKGVDPALTFDSWFNSARTLPVGTFTENLFGILNFRTIWELGTSELLRPSSTFIDVNTGASFVGIFLLLGSGWWLSSLKDLKEKFNWDRALALGGLALIILISLGYFLLTISRSAALGLGVGAAVFLFFLLRGRLGTRFVGLLLAILVISAAWFGFNLSYGRRTSSSLERVEYAQAAWGMFKENPLTGVGVGNFEPYCLKVLRTDLPACYSHSIFLTWLGELGILGIIANLVLITVVFYFSSKLINTISRDSTDYLRVSGLLSAFTALVFSNIFHAHYGLDFTWVLLGLLVSCYYLTKRSLLGRISDLGILGVRVDNVTM
ncbi:MAG: O-antigen ligase family protein, partial [Patescibacteria group bacterium]